ncbi:hypothetical protein [Synechocystis sp. LKSZ1]|uniref:hypothetical protein n=1 Tax=Synechocystis sp. LKSZ1 TaxID=3144951 RepID=UPI00336BEC0E
MVTYRQLTLFDERTPSKPVETISSIFTKTYCYRCVYGPVYCLKATFGIGMKCYTFKQG